MDGLFLIAVKNLKILSDLGRGDRIDDTTFITNNRDVVKGLLKPECVPVLGTLEAGDIVQSDAVIYSKDNIPEDLTPEQYLIAKLYRVKAFEMAIWLMQDNNVNSEQGFLIYKKDGTTNVSGNFIATHNSTASGEDVCLSLRRQELKMVREFFRQKVYIEKHAHILPTTQLTKSASRISRVYYLVQGARCQSDLALKLSQYCSVLEALFSTSTAELAHQLAERVAYFLEVGGESRYKTYRAIKKAYDFRSRIVHGDTIKTSVLDDLRAAALLCDDLIRRSLQKIISKREISDLFGAGSKELDDYFLRLCLNVPEEKAS